jgi:misacylated tRNA(Ala) deacylase
MATETLFVEDAYRQSCSATVVEADGGAIVLDRTVFYPTGGGQPGDTGTLAWAGGAARVVDTRKGEAGAIRHVLEEGAELPAVGAAVTATIDWDRRYRHMRMHTAMHLLSTVVPHGVTGGSISVDRSRLDFDMQGSTVDKTEVTTRLQELVAADRPVSSTWITDAELDAQPDLVKTLSVSPPRGVGRVRLVKIEGLDLQPCGGTHLASTGEVGAVRISKVENKGRQNRRLHIVLDD